jgi:hypothetical protein
MRRLLVSLLLAVFSFPLFAPALLASADSNLPACCRRNGKHGCSMPSGSKSTSGISLHAVHCPMSPAGSQAPAADFVAVLKGSGAVFAALVSHPSVHVQTEAIGRVAFSRSSQKRGPPIVLS